MESSLPPPESIITASIFSSFPNVVFGLSSGSDGDAALRIQNRREFLRYLGIQSENLAIPGQVHGDNVARVDRPGRYEQSDALMTNQRDVFLSITVADCLPVFFFDAEHEVVAAVHAGWRGCFSGIVKKAVTMMVDGFSTKPTALRVFVGPSARKCCYEVGPEVAHLFDEKFLWKNEGGRHHLDMLGFTVERLSEVGVCESQTEISPFCTICSSYHFPSYRRGGVDCGRIVGVIGIKSY